MLCAFSSCNEHYIALADVGIPVFQEEHLVNPIVLESGKLDKKAYWTSQALFKDEILLPSNLQAS
jgi:hypothetical protein